jgi:uncharacterized surface protein with fasciclin (FAS1) repeats
MLYHVVPGAMSTDEIRALAHNNASMITLLGEDAISTHRKSGGKVYLDDLVHYDTMQVVIRPHDLKAKNGIIHTINRSLLVKIA